MASNITNLEKIFNNVRDIARYGRKKHGDRFDGFTYWQSIKKVLKQYDDENIRGSKWKKINASLVDKIMNLPEKYINGYGDEVIIESNHFIIQQVRLPKQEFSIRKVVQLGENIGQWEGSPDREVYKDIKYPKTKLNTLGTYVTKAFIKNSSKYITDEVVEQIANITKNYLIMLEI